MGTMNVTKSGKPCQAWASHTPHGHSRNLAKYFPDETMEDVGNFCRNPDWEPSPWCYTTDPAVRFEECNIKLCEREYLGQVSLFWTASIAGHCSYPYHFITNSSVSN